MRIAAPLTTSGFPVQSFATMRASLASSVDASPELGETFPGASPSSDSDFHSIMGDSLMERQSLESSSSDQESPRDSGEATPQSPADSSTPERPSPSGTANAPHWQSSSVQSNRSSQTKSSDSSSQSGAQASSEATTDTSSSTSTDLKKLLLNGRLFGDLSLEQQDEADGTAGAANAQSNEDDAAQTAPGGQANATAASTALLAQRANAGLLAATMLGLDAKRSGAALAKDDAAGTGNSLSQNLSALDPGADSSDAVAAGQAGTLAGRGSLQLSSAADGDADPGDPRIQESTSGASNPNDQVAFEAKLSPAAGSANSSTSAAAQQSSGSSNQGGSADQGTAKQSSDGSADDASSNAVASAPVLKTAIETSLAPQAAQAAPPPVHHPTTPAAAAQSDSSAAERMQSMIEAPSPLASSRHSILVKVPGETAGTGIDLRFVERAGDIHLSVRTPSSEVAQQLRGGLNDLVGKLEHAGIRAEVSSPSTGDAQLSNQSKDQNSQQDSSPDRRGGRNQADSQSQQQPSREQNQSQWFQAIADSAGQTETSTFSKEQNI